MNRAAGPKQSVRKIALPKPVRLAAPRTVVEGSNVALDVQRSVSGPQAAAGVKPWPPR